MTQKIIYLIVISSFILVSCGKKEEVARGADQKTENQQEEPLPTIASVTEDQVKAAGITIGSVEMKELTSTSKVNGLLQVPNDSKARVTSLYGGIIKTIEVQVGSMVRKGQVIATISNPEFIQLQEDYLTVNSRITFAEQEYRRQKELFDNDAGAKKNLQSSDAELKTLRTRRASLLRQLQMMGISPAKVNNGSMRSGLVITSPINGTVSSISAQIGSYVDISSPVAEIIDNSSLHLDLQVFEKDLPKMKVGQTVRFRPSNNPEQVYDAQVYNIGSSFEGTSKTISVHCNVIGNKEGLLDGMNIVGMISLDNKTTTAVRNEAIVEAEGKYYIFVQTDKKPENDTHNEGKEGNYSGKSSGVMNFEKTEVIKGFSDMGYTAIVPVKEINPDAKIVTKGAFFVNAKLSNSEDHAH